MCENMMSLESRDLPIQVNMVKLVGVASRITAGDEQQGKHKAKVKLSVSHNPVSHHNSHDVCVCLYSCLLMH